MNTTNTNGTVPSSNDELAESLQEEATVGYRPTMPLEGMWRGGFEMPTVTLRRDIEFMRIHPIVSSGMEYYSSGIRGAEFWGGPDQQNPDNDKGIPISESPDVSQFVLMHVERFWQRGVPLIQEDGYPYGWAPGEHMYKDVKVGTRNLLTWSHLKVFHPLDGHILTYKYQPVGIRVKSIREKSSVDLHFATETVPAKACWYAHRPRASSLYGRSQYTGAWLPWRMIGWKDGMDSVINAAVYRGGYSGPIVQHPPEDMQAAQEGIPATRLDGAGKPRRSARDVARQMVEWAKAGAGFTHSSAVYPGTNVPKWAIKWPDHVMDVRPLIEAARWAEERILLGMGVPPELIKAGGTGSGYSGRSIPREAFLDQQQRIADAILQMFVEQVLRPLVFWNFGDVPFNVQCKSLLKSQSDDKQGNDQQGKPGEQGQPDNMAKSQAAKDSWAKRKGGAGGETAQPPQAPALSIEEHSKRLYIASRVLRRRAA